MRPKVYGKTLEFLTSEGISRTGVNEPLFQCYNSKSHKNCFKRNVATTEETKQVVCRFETSFYG